LVFAAPAGVKAGVARKAAPLGGAQLGGTKLRDRAPPVRGVNSAASEDRRT
jgi:hypothetical protein